MGYYVNPPEPKEAWLAREATRISTPDSLIPDKVVVCLVSNGAFTAAGIVYSQQELEAFADSSDTRPKVWYSVEVDKMLDIHPEYAQILTKAS